MSCLVNLRIVREELSVNEKKIADFILKNSALIRDYSSQNLAASVGVSQSSIIKFSQKLNYRGFTDLKLAIHESVIKSEDPDRPTTEIHHVKDKTDSISLQLYNIRNDALITTIELNDEDRLMAAVRKLEQARRIQIIALGACSLVASSFANALIQIGKSVIANVDSYTQQSSIATLGENDVLFVISFSGQSSKIMQMTQQAKKAGVTIISLTNFGANPIRSLADVRLFSVGHEDRFEVPQIISNASQQHVVDVLFSKLLKRDKKAKERLTRNLKAAESL